MDVEDDFQRNYPRDDELSTETQRCRLGQLGNDGDEGGGGDHLQTKTGYERFAKDGRVAAGVN